MINDDILYYLSHPRIKYISATRKSLVYHLHTYYDLLELTETYCDYTMATTLMFYIPFKVQYILLIFLLS